ncbi:MAG: 2-oxoacid:acceptor oxidoreductase family protein [Zestosphaera sp.]
MGNLKMFEIRWHGRGGMGAVTAADLTASAAIKAGFYALAFPEFGAERRGAPVTAYTRIDERVIYDRTPITNPDAIVVLDPFMITSPRILAGIKEGGYLIANTSKDPAEVLDQLSLRRLKVTTATVDATEIAMQVFKQPIVNTAMIGALIGVTNIVPLEEVLSVVRERFPERLAEPNVRLINESYKSVKVVRP